MKVKTVDRLEAAEKAAETGEHIWNRLSRGPSGEVLLTDALIETFEMLLLEGNTRNNAARVVGLARTTMARWLKKGVADIDEHKNTPEARFTFAVDRAEGEQERRLSRKAFVTATGTISDGTLALKLLERRNPDEWAPALPDTPDGASQFAALKMDAIQKEAMRVLKAAAKPEELIGEVVKPDKP